MGYRDSQMLLAEAQVETAIGDQVSTNRYDAGAAQDSGVGEPLILLAKVNTTVTSGGAATVQAVLQTSDTEGSGYTDLAAGEEVALADLVAGKKLLELKVPHLGKQFYQVVWRIGTAVLTAGSFDAWFIKDAQNNTTYPKGFVV